MRKFEDNIIKPSIETEAGLLPHEMHFTLLSLGAHRVASREANLAVGAANEQSGGDWALDDPSVRDAAFEAHRVEIATSTLARLSVLNEIDYPDLGSDEISYGTRLTLEEESGDEEVYDLGTRAAIAGMPMPDSSILVSPEAPLGKALLGKKVGETVVWQVASREFSGVVRSIDQEAIRTEYKKYLSGK